VSFKEDSVDSLGNVCWCRPCWVFLFGEIHVGELRADFIVVEFLMRFGFRFRDVGWKVVIPCEHMIQCCSASLAFPCIFLLCVGVSPRAAKEVFHFVISRSYYLIIERLCIVPSASRVCTIEVPLQNYTVFFLLDYPIFRRIPHFSLPHGVGGGKLVVVHELEGDACWFLSIKDGESTV